MLIEQRQKRYWLWGGLSGALAVPVVLTAALSLVKASGITNEVGFLIPMVSAVSPFGFILLNFIEWSMSYYYRLPPDPGNLAYIGVNLAGWFAAGAFLGNFYGKLKATPMPTARRVSYFLLAVVGLCSLTGAGWSLSWRLPYANDPPAYRRYARSQLKATDDPAVCERLSGNRRAACYFQLALLKNDENLCLKLPASGFLANQKTCYSKLAFRKHDEKICRMIAEIQNIEECVADTALAKDDTNLCEGLSVSGKATCYTNFTRLKMEDYCRLITDNTIAREQCYRRLTRSRSSRDKRDPILDRHFKTLLSDYDE